MLQTVPSCRWLAPAMGVKGLCVWARVLVNTQQRALLNVEKQIHASLRPRGTRTRDAARPAMQRRGSCIADSRPQQ